MPKMLCRLEKGCEERMTRFLLIFQYFSIRWHLASNFDRMMSLLHPPADFQPYITENVRTDECFSVSNKSILAFETTEFAESI